MISLWTSAIFFWFQLIYVHHRDYWRGIRQTWYSAFIWFACGKSGAKTTLAFNCSKLFLLSVINVELKGIAVMVFWPKSDLSIMNFIEVALKEGWIWYQKLILAYFVFNYLSATKDNRYRLHDSLKSVLLMSVLLINLIQNCSNSCSGRISSSVVKAKFRHITYSS